MFGRKHLVTIFPSTAVMFTTMIALVKLYVVQLTNMILQYRIDAVIVMYSVTDRESFNEVEQDMGDITREINKEAKEIPILIVG